MARRRCLERLRADHQADIQKYWQDGHQRHHRQQQRGQAQEAHQRDDDAGGQRIADAATDRFPAGMADIHGWRERRAKHRPGKRADAVGQQHLAQVEVVACGGGAFDVVHALREVVDAKRHRDDQQRADVG